MKVKCIECGKIFEDNYKNLNEFNVRVWCNSCINKKWKRRSKK